MPGRRNRVTLAALILMAGLLALFTVVYVAWLR
jgi:hypothetical protein